MGREWNRESMGMGCWDQAEAIAAPRTLSSSSSSLVAKSCPTLVTPKTVACQTPPSMGLSRQEYWSGLPFPSAEDLPNPGIEPGPPALQADSFIDWSPSWRSLSKPCKCPDILLSLPSPSTGGQSPLVTLSVSLVPYTGPDMCNTIFSFPLLDVGAEELLELELLLPLVPPHSWSCFLTPGHTTLSLFLVQGCRAVEHLLIVSWL